MNSAALSALPVLALVALTLQQSPEPEEPDSGLVTLYARDDLQCAFDFRSGAAGGRVEDGEIHLEGAQLAFDVLAHGQLSFGFVRDERVEVLDLGEVSVPPQPRARDLAAKFPLSIVHTLFFDGTRFGYRGPGGDPHAFERADAILGSLPPERTRHLEPLVGHAYLVRIHREGLGKHDELFAFEVVDLEPARSVTLRWTTVH